jgi:hypothetical protein
MNETTTRRREIRWEDPAASAARLPELSRLRWYRRSRSTATA